MSNELDAVSGKSEKNSIPQGLRPDRKPLSSRQLSILKAIVEDYVQTCEPVGSNALLKRHQLGVSSATVRNEMAELEVMGYLEQPHTSAGRIPSDLGYRAYVNQILTVQELPESERRHLQQSIGEQVSEMKALIQKAGETLAEDTALTSLILTPTYGHATLKQMRILMIEPGRALVVVVLSAGVVKDRLIQVPDYLTEDQLQDIGRSLEASLTGRKLQDITLVTVVDAGQQEQIPEALLRQVLFEAYLSIKQAENIDVYMKGSHQMLRQPEFSDIHRAHRFLDTLSQNGLIAGYLSELNEEDAAEDQEESEQSDQGRESMEGTESMPTGMSVSLPRPAYTVRIGREIALEGLEDCSFVSTSYRFGDQVKGKIAVVGPKRMLYSKIISQVQFVNRLLGNQMKRLTQGDSPDMREKE